MARIDKKIAEMVQEKSTVQVIGLAAGLTWTTAEKQIIMDRVASAKLGQTDTVPVSSKKTACKAGSLVTRFQSEKSGA
jgi:hypothetical protein